MSCAALLPDKKRCPNRATINVYCPDHQHLPHVAHFLPVLPPVDLNLPRDLLFPTLYPPFDQAEADRYNAQVTIKQKQDLMIPEVCPPKSRVARSSFGEVDWSGLSSSREDIGAQETLSCLVKSPFQGIVDEAVSLNVFRMWIRDLESIGKGVEGEVRTAELLGITTKPYALKFGKDLEHEASMTIRSLNTLRREIPNFCYVYGFIKAPKLISPSDKTTKFKHELQDCLVIENIVKGVTFHNFITRQGSDYNVLASIFLQITYAMQMAYELVGFNHLDFHAGNIIVQTFPNEIQIRYRIRGENIFLKSRYLAVIIDYGWSRTNTYHKKFFLIDGTTPYPFFDIHALLFNFSYSTNLWYDVSRRIYPAITRIPLIRNVFNSYPWVRAPIRIQRSPLTEGLDYLILEQIIRHDYFDFLSSQPFPGIHTFNCDYGLCLSKEERISAAVQKPATPIDLYEEYHATDDKLTILNSFPTDWAHDYMEARLRIIQLELKTIIDNVRADVIRTTSGVINEITAKFLLNNFRTVVEKRWDVYSAYRVISWLIHEKHIVRIDPVTIIPSFDDPIIELWKTFLRNKHWGDNDVIVRELMYSMEVAFS